MSLGNRFKTSFALVVLCIFLLSICDMLFSIGLVSKMLSPWLIVPAFGVAWLLAPVVASRFPLK